MPNVLGSKGRSLPEDYKAVIVGVADDVKAVQVIWLSHDRRMTSHRRSCCLPPGQTAPGVAITIFGLTRFRVFPAAKVEKAWPYAVRLAREIEGGVLGAVDD